MESDQESEVLSEHEEFTARDQPDLSTANIFEDSIENPKRHHLKI
jgi:hypothetical protein